MKRERIPYDVINTDENVNYSSGTVKLLNGNKILVSLVIGLSIIIDIIILALLSTRESINIHFLIPIITIVIDAIFLLLSFFVNFKFKNSNYIWIGYCISAVVLPFAFAATSIAGGEVATIIALAVNILAHIISATMVALVVNAIRNKSKFKSLLVGIAATVVVVLSAVGTCSYFGAMGVWGQDSQRTVVYVEEADGYHVADVLPGKSDTVKIKTTFNGKPVISIDANILIYCEIKNFIIEGDKKLKFYNEEKIELLNNPINLSVDKALINSYRDDLYSISKTRPKEGFQNIINGLSPNNLSEDEVYMEFEFNIIEPNVVNYFDKLTPSVITTKGSDFSYNNVSGALHDLLADEKTGSLEWAYNYGNKIVLNQNLRSELSVNKKYHEITTFNVSFDDVYRVKIKGSNDYVFNYDNEWTTADSTGFRGKYFTEKTSEKIFKSIPTREGFSVYNQSSELNNIDSAKKLVTAVNYNANAETEIYQEWTMNAPQVQALNINENGYVYGDKINMGIEAARNGFDYHYTIIDNNANEIFKGSNIQEYCIKNLAKPFDSGNYSVVVYATHVNSSLKSENVIYRKTINVKKKNLNVVWDKPLENEFNGNYKNVTCKLNQTDIVNNDPVTLSINTFPYRDAGNYELSTNIPLYWQEFYDISETQNTQYKITPKKIQAVWSNEKFVYNAFDQLPSAIAYDIYNNKLSVGVMGATAKAGTHIATIYWNDSNYDITNKTKAFTIAKKEYIPKWSSSNFEYNGQQQSPQFYEGEGDIYGEARKQLSLSEYPKNAGTYNLKIKLPDSSNFYIADANSNMAVTISKKAITVHLIAGNYTYNGKLQKPTVSFSGLIAGAAEIETVNNELQFGNLQSNAGTYNVTVALPDKSNYSMEQTSFNIVISKRNINVYIENANKVYDGAKYNDFKITTSNIAEGDLLSEIMDYTFSGNAVGAINAGNYEIGLNVVKREKYSNYSVSIINGELTIEKRQVNLTWSGGNSFVEGSAIIAPTAVGIDSSLITYKYYTKSGALLSVKPTRAGEYRVEAVVNSANYNLSNNIQSYTIVTKGVK